MKKKEAEELVAEMWEELQDHVKTTTQKIEKLCDEHGIVKYFTGLPPFDSYGNSGYYFPMKTEPESYGEPWIDSDEMRDLGGHYARAGEWISSSERC